MAGVGFVAVSGLVGAGTGVASRKYNRRSTGSGRVAEGANRENEDDDEEVDDDEGGNAEVKVIEGVQLQEKEGCESIDEGEDDDDDEDEDEGSCSGSDGVGALVRHQDSQSSDTRSERQDSIGSVISNSGATDASYVKQKRRKSKRYSRGNYITIGSYDRETAERWRLKISNAIEVNRMRQNHFFEADANDDEIQSPDDDLDTSQHDAQDQGDAPESASDEARTAGDLTGDMGALGLSNSTKSWSTSLKRKKKVDKVTRYLHGAQWVLLQGGWNMGGSSSLRIYTSPYGKSRQSVSSSDLAMPPCPPLKTTMVLQSSPIAAFKCIMNLGRVQDNVQVDLSNKCFRYVMAHSPLALLRFDFFLFFFF